MENFNPDSLETICRVCLKDKGQTYSMHSRISMPGSGFISVPEIFEKLAFEEFETNMLICSVCTKLIISAYTLKLNYDNATAVLKNYHNNKQEYEILMIKTEEQPNNSFINENTKVNDTLDDIKEPFIFVNTETPVDEHKKERKKKKKATQQDISQSDPILHPCPICPAELSAEDLRKHAHTHKTLKKYLNVKNRVPETIQFYGKRKVGKLNVSTHECTYCAETFSAKDLRIHLLKHRNVQEYKCDKCSRVFKKINHLNVHRISHFKEFPYNCEVCRKGFVSKKNYEFHMLTHSDVELPFECGDCSKRFYNPEHLNRHRLIHIENVRYSMKYKVCKCRLCLVSFKDKESRDNHVCTPVTPKVNKYFCKTCERGFKYNSELNNHVKHTHEMVKSLCQVCGEHVSNIYSHMVKHSSEKPHACDQCEKQFHTKRQLKQHQLVHSGLKPFVCSVCAKAFNNIYNLQVHERIHKGDRCHVCSICGKGFLEKSYLKKHMNTH
ncbi:unnamed protein product [Brassicogethes aeneus]|uniref:C2H2-type domain-containing protein n=1 Tax=Brassicogethes aeneus TaxID=1431903 RepID=A0A9P0B2L5_BRAAE|nr:unnamed protein product [Brassicogethes aeneus]